MRAASTSARRRSIVATTGSPATSLTPASCSRPRVKSRSAWASASTRCPARVAGRRRPGATPPARPSSTPTAVATSRSAIVPAVGEARRSPRPGTLPTAGAGRLVPRSGRGPPAQGGRSQLRVHETLLSNGARTQSRVGPPVEGGLLPDGARLAGASQLRVQETSLGDGSRTQSQVGASGGTGGRRVGGRRRRAGAPEAGDGAAGVGHVVWSPPWRTTPTSSRSARCARRPLSGPGSTTSGWAPSRSTPRSRRTGPGHAPRRRRAPRPPTGSASCRWRDGTARPTAAPPTSCAGAGGGSAPAGRGSCGPRPPPSVPTGGPTPTSWSSTSARSTTWPPCAASWSPPTPRRAGAARQRGAPATGRSSACSSRTPGGGAGPTARPGPASPTGTPCSTTGSAPPTPPWSTDGELDELAADYVRAAVLAAEAGFDFVDVKHCHGYLAHELLSAVDRPGRYGGDLDGRTRFLRTVAEGVRAAAPGLGLAMRLSAFDLVPFRGRAPTAAARPSRRPAGATATPSAATAPAWASTSPRSTSCCGGRQAWGVSLVSVTAGSPYYVPARPAAGVLPAVGRLPAAPRPAGRRGPPAGGDRRAGAAPTPAWSSWRRASATCSSGCPTPPRRWWDGRRGAPPATGAWR